jgi:hypothetical protein
MVIFIVHPIGVRGQVDYGHVDDSQRRIHGGLPGELLVKSVSCKKLTKRWLISPLYIKNLKKGV